MKISLSKRFLLLSSILLLAVLCFTFSPQIPSAHAASVSTSIQSLDTPDIAFSCPSRTICFYQNDNGTGTRISCATSVCRGAWFSTTVGGVHAGSFFDNSASIVFTGDVQDSTEVCWNHPPGTGNLKHTFGYYYVEYGVGSCPPKAQWPPLP